MSSDSPFLPDEENEPQDLPTPWGFRFTLVAVGIYLLYRVGQGVVWVIERMM